MKKQKLINSLSEFWKVYNTDPNYRVTIKSTSGCISWFFENGDDAQDLFNTLGANMGKEETISLFNFENNKIIFEGSSTDNYPTTHTPTREEVEGLPKDAINNILFTLNYKGFELVFFVDCNRGNESEYNFNCYYKGRYIKYVDYPDYVSYRKHDLNGYIEYIQKKITTKLFNFEDIETLNDYNDYQSKKDFVINILPQMFDSVSSFDHNFENIKSAYLYTGSSYSYYFKNKEDAQLTIKLYVKLRVLFNKVIIKNKKNLYKAIVSEMFNHETPYNWDGWEPALNALGLSEKTLTAEQKQIAARAYKHVLNAIDW